MMKSIFRYLIFLLPAIYAFPAAAQLINGSNVPTDEVVVTYWDEKKKKIRSKGKYNYSGFSGIGKEDGKWEYWYENGKLEEVAHYNKGKLHGKVTKYWENGKKMQEGYFKNDFVRKILKSPKLWERLVLLLLILVFLFIMTSLA